MLKSFFKFSIRSRATKHLIQGKELIEKKKVGGEKRGGRPPMFPKNGEKKKDQGGKQNAFEKQRMTST